MDRFSSRHGFQPPEAEIAVRNDAPRNLRGVIVDLAYESGFTPHKLRRVVCSTLRVPENPENWSAFPNVDGEVRHHLDSCEWYYVYDIIEAIYAQLSKTRSVSTDQAAEAQDDHFALEINKVFRRDGIGWQLLNGEVQMRGPEMFEEALKRADHRLRDSGRTTAANELQESLRDLSRRPTPDRTGALQHALASLECVMRDVCGDPKATLGTLLAQHKAVVPPPLDQALDKIWGFASEQGRHIREGREPEVDEVQLAVHVSAAVATYLIRKVVPQQVARADG